VVSINDIGESLPSSRILVSTKDGKHLKNIKLHHCLNISVDTTVANLPHIAVCCEQANVPRECVSQLCSLNSTYSSNSSPFSALSMAVGCRDHFPAVAPCLAGRRLGDWVMSIQ
jgi:hypothetical protein